MPPPLNFDPEYGGEYTNDREVAILCPTPIECWPRVFDLGVHIGVYQPSQTITLSNNW